tara:strand:- start:131 stop:937 length:807 start_codon:yes stop_codon:yes gene_type:complete
MNLKQILKSKLTKKQVSLLPSSYSIVGSIAIFAHFPEELKTKEKLIANTLLKLNKNIETVAKKTKQYSGKYRTPKIKIIAGKKTKVTTYKENEIILKLNVETCYFSPRLSNERLRISNLVKPKESVLVLFSGVGPYTIQIAKKAKEVYSIEINPTAIDFQKENILLNRLDNVRLYKGDVNKILPTINKKFDRIVMPLPKSAEDFLKIALTKAKKGSVIHFYDFQEQSELKNSVEKVKKHIKNFKLLKVIKCGQFGPGKFRVCVDFKIT